MGRIIARAPGRVNLIGEHTDYNGGSVLPVAIDLGLTLVADPARGPETTLVSDGFRDTAVIAPEADPARLEPAWARLPAAVLAALREAGFEVPPFAGRIAGDLPPGGGLASSAALAVAVALAAQPLSGRDRRRLAPLLASAEARARGVRCGIMDPWICLFAEEDSALLIDCRSERHEVVPLPEELGLVVADSGARHDLAAGDYERRRAECEAAVDRLRGAGFGLGSLGDLRPDDLDRATAALGAPLDRRVRHVVTENDRTLRAADALRAGDLADFGRLLNESHESLRTDYDVSTSALDALVEIARAAPGAFGARLTGGGFGGSTVTAVAAERAGDVAASVAEEYARRTGREGRARVVTTSGAAWVAGSRKA